MFRVANVHLYIYRRSFFRENDRLVDGGAWLLKIGYKFFAEFWDRPSQTIALFISLCYNIQDGKASVVATGGNIFGYRFFLSKELFGESIFEKMM